MADDVEDRMLAAFRRLPRRKREPLVRWMEEFFQVDPIIAAKNACPAAGNDSGDAAATAKIGGIETSI